MRLSASRARRPVTTHLNRDPPRNPHRVPEMVDEMLFGNGWCPNREGGRGMLDAATQHHGARAVAAAQQTYRRVLTGWAQDLLRARVRGCDVPGRRHARGLVAVPMARREAA